VARMEEAKNVYRIFVGDTFWKAKIPEPRRILGDNVEMDFREICYSTRACFCKAVMNFTVP